jgi:hypothetical protein
MEVNPMKTFVRTHERLLTLLGASIVFFTFLTKDALRENLKDLTNSIEQTQNAFLERRDTKFLTDRINHVKKILNVVYFDKLRDKGETAELSAIADAQGEMDDRIFRSLTTLANARSIVEQLSSRNSQEETRRLLIRLARSTRSSCVTDTDEDVVYDMKGCTKKVASLRSRLESFVESILDDARLKRRQYGRASEVFGWISLFLYIVGWGLGFIGKVYGIETTAGSE